MATLCALRYRTSQGQNNREAAPPYIGESTRQCFRDLSHVFCGKGGALYQSKRRIVLRFGTFYFCQLFDPYVPTKGTEVIRYCGEKLERVHLRPENRWLPYGKSNLQTWTRYLCSQSNTSCYTAVVSTSGLAYVRTVLLPRLPRLDPFSSSSHRGNSEWAWSRLLSEGNPFPDLLVGIKEMCELKDIFPDLSALDQPLDTTQDVPSEVSH